MQIIKPQKLKKGDVIGLIAPASAPEETSRIEMGVRHLEKLGYRVQLGKNLYHSVGYLAGTDEERLDDLHSMFKDKNVKAIICVRGGYGAFRILDKVDYSLIKRNPKIFVGYSEITALQNAILNKTGLVTFAGPMLAVDLYSDQSKYTEEYFWASLTSNKKLGRIEHPDDNKIPFLNKGTAMGRIVGGNLAVFTALVGTDYMPDLKDKILMIEDIGELPYRIDRLLNQLRLSKSFKKLRGIILARFVDCFEHDPNKKTLTLGEVIEHYISPLNIPTLYTFPHGHIKDFATIPFGIRVKINAARGIVEFLEAGVK